MNRLHTALAIVAALAAVAAGVVDRRPVDRGARTGRTGRTGTIEFISAPDLALRIMQGDRDLRVFDLRTPEAYAQFHVPGARRTAATALAEAALPPRTHVVLYGDARATILEALQALSKRNHRDVLVLREGLYEWLSRVHEPRLAAAPTPEERAEFERAAEMSRFFGGVPRVGVPREDVPQGYWTGMPRSEELLMAAAVKSVAAIRRRGC
jgi:rhodanese-related sulfurtransferase